MFLAARPHHMLPHRMGELIQFNYLLEHNAISFNQEGLLQIDFDVLDSVLHKMLDETIAVQLSKSPEQAEKFINKYTLWGEYSAKIADVHKKLGLKPYKKIIRYF